jgi:hypothetical protein
MFYPQLTEAHQAWDEIGRFIADIESEAGIVSAGDV